VRVGGQLVFNNIYQILAAAVEGFGLAYVPKTLAELAVKAGQLKWVMEDWFPTFMGHHAYYPTRRKSSMAVQLVIEALKTTPSQIVCPGNIARWSDAARASQSFPPDWLGLPQLMAVCLNHRRADLCSSRQSAMGGTVSDSFGQEYFPVRGFCDYASLRAE
jgi:hypothetical protein